MKANPPQTPSCIKTLWLAAYNLHCLALLLLHPHGGICRVGIDSMWHGEKFTTYQLTLCFSLTKMLKKMLKGSLIARRKTPES